MSKLKGGKWKRLELTYELESPLHIGFLPSKGSVVSPSRYYVPGKNFWGAVTKTTTEYLFSHPIGKDYQNIGEEIAKYFRFSYFYILEGNEIYFPCVKGTEKVYGGKSKLTNCEFESKFIGSRASTAIDFHHGISVYGSLHEIEYIKNKYVNDGSIETTELRGVIFFYEDNLISIGEKNQKQAIVRDDGIYIDNFNILRDITLGGEQNYGFGRVKLLNIREENSYLLDCWDSEEKEIFISVKSGQPVLSHVKFFDEASLYFQGDIELVSGREYKKSQGRYQKPGAHVVKPMYCFSPGTVFYMDQKSGEQQESKIIFLLKYDGTMEKVDAIFEDK